MGLPASAAEFWSAMGLATDVGGGVEIAAACTDAGSLEAAGAEAAPASAGCSAGTAAASSAGLAASDSTWVPSALRVDGSGLSNFCIFCQARRPGVMVISLEMVLE